MCGISGIVGGSWKREELEAMVRVQQHRGPDDQGIYINASQTVGLGHNRLSIIDLSTAGHQPMTNNDRSLWIVLNGEIYNYPELRSELRDYPFRSRTDTEVVLAAYERWGAACLDHFIGMFSLAIWDERKRCLFAARDRFGVKPFYYSTRADGTLLFASEIKALHVAGIPQRPDARVWSTYLATGMYDHRETTFWDGVHSLQPGHSLAWDFSSGTKVHRWYDAAAGALDSGEDLRKDEEVEEHLLSLLEESVKLRFRSDVEVGVCLSGGLDSSLLLGLIQKIYGNEASINTFTFHTGDARYDETPWVQQMLDGTKHKPHFCLLSPSAVPELAERVQQSQDEPFGGFPTLGMALVHEHARRIGVTVLLDGNGMDEGWAGYDYYQQIDQTNITTGPVQGTTVSPVRPDCLTPEFATLSTLFTSPTPFNTRVSNLQYRDIRYSKIPRAMRFADRVSMMYSRELREPFLDHRIIELGLRQPITRKIRDGQGKWLPRVIARKLVPQGVSETPKRPVQTPQREWLREALKDWASGCMEDALTAYGGTWLQRDKVLRSWSEYCNGVSDNSFYIWQWINLGLLVRSTIDDKKLNLAQRGVSVE